MIIMIDRGLWQEESRLWGSGQPMGSRWGAKRDGDLALVRHSLTCMPPWTVAGRAMGGQRGARELQPTEAVGMVRLEFIRPPE